MGATRLGANTKLPLDYEAQQKAEGTGPASRFLGLSSRGCRGHSPILLLWRTALMRAAMLLLLTMTWTAATTTTLEQIERSLWINYAYWNNDRLQSGEVPMRREPGGRQHTTTCWPVLPARDLRNFASTTWPGTTATPCLTDARPAHASKGNDDACSTWSQGTSTPLSCLSWTTPSLPNSIGTTSPWAACVIGESRSTMRTGWIRWGGPHGSPCC